MTNPSARVAGLPAMPALACVLAASVPAAAQVAWIDPFGGAWTDGANWSTGVAPGPGDTVKFTIAAVVPYDVLLDTSAHVAGIDVGNDQPRLLLGRRGSVFAEGPLSTRIGLGLVAGQSSRLHVIGGVAQVKNVLIGMAPFTDAELELSGGAVWSADGFVTLGFNGGGATLVVRDGAALTTTASLQTLGGFTDELPIRCRFAGAGTTGAIGGSLSTGAAVNIIEVHDGARVDIDGDAHVITDNQADVGGLDVRDRGSMLVVGGSLSIGGGLWGIVRVVDGGQLVVGVDVLAGVTAGVDASRLEIDGGTVVVLGDIRLGSDPQALSGHVHVESGTLAVAGAMRTLEHDPFHSIVVSGPSTMAGPVDISSSWVSSGMTLHQGAVVASPQLAVGPGAAVQCSGGSVVGAVALDGTLAASIGPNAAVPRLAIAGGLAMDRSARIAVTLGNTPAAEVARVVDVVGDATVDGDLVVDVSFMWWNGPRRPVEIVRADIVAGAFARVMLDSPPFGPPLELRQSADVIRIQADFVEDLDDDGLVDSADLGLLLAAWGPGPSPADFNGDGVVDGGDLALMLAAWNGL